MTFLADTVPDHVWSTDTQRHDKFYNKAFLAYLGAATGLEVSSWTDALHPDERTSRMQAWEEALQSGEEFNTRARFRRHDGVYRWFRIRAAAQRDDSGNIARWVGVNSDIDDDVRAQLSFADSISSLEKAATALTAERRRLWRLSREILVITDQTGKWLDVNPAGEELLKRGREEILAAPPNTFVHPHDHDKTIAYREMSLRTNRRGTFEQRLVDAEGTVRLISWIATSEDNHIYASGRDITEQRERENQLAQVQKMDAIGNLTGGVAHDFNNLLTVILSALDEVVHELPSGTALHDKLMRAYEASQHGADLTSRLLAFARRQPLEPRICDIGRRVAKARQMLGSLLGENVAVTYGEEPALWTAMADPGQVENAILNLCINARDSMPAGGTITIETANVVLDADYISFNPDVAPGEYVLIAVSDTGLGMAPEVLARAFDPFFTTKEVGEGSGMGLSMVYGFAKQSGGYAKIYSELGYGTTVKLFLPRADSIAAPDAPAPTEMAVERGGSEHILLVEDDDLLRSHVEKMLQGLGYDVTVAANGPAALVALDAAPHIDLLLSDVVMPGGMNGRELANEVLRRRPALNVLFMSGYSENAIVHQGRLDPGVHLLSKPFRRAALAAKLRQLLD